MGHPVFDVAGCSALVTGSSRGIGRALAAGLQEAGCAIVLHGRDPEGAAQAAAELPGARHVAFDVTDPDAVERGAAEIGPLDILVGLGLRLRPGALRRRRECRQSCEPGHLRPGPPPPD